MELGSAENAVIAKLTVEEIALQIRLLPNLSVILQLLLQGIT